MPAVLEEVPINDSPLVLGVPGHYYSFFGGPLFLGIHDDKLREHYEKIKIPLNILRDDEKRRNLAELLSSLNPKPGLFSGESDLEELFPLILEQKHLYQIWKQKVNGKERSFYVPQKAFKTLLTNYVLPFVKAVPAHPSCHGGEKGWTVKKSLESHLPVVSSLTFDMSAAYHQATMNYVFEFFYDSLEGRCKTEEQRRDAAVFLSAVCTIRKDYDERREECFEASLPEGSAVSSAVFNRMLLPIDEEFSRFAEKKGIKYSRWIDDFVFTSPKKRKFNHFEYVMRKAQESFTLAPRKVFFTYEGVSYLLGHKIAYNEIEKISREEFEKQRGEPYTGGMLSDTHPWDCMYEGYEEPTCDGNDIPF
ncbi:hypothetical protein A3K73_04995 [Candidatus Pacearchaeota archaeon RBG_13_36_9]|nr:MAG: hypothetical protein A3K73_04995 [Candidatus Pacearchaeota archaeon RBG_13_36_9]